MPKPAKPPPKQLTATLDPETEQPEKVDLTDAHAIKYKLDTTAADVILQAGYAEDHLINNVKIALGVFGIACAVYSHFGVGKFPGSWYSILYCVIAYIVTNIILYVFCLVKEGDSFLVTQPKLGHEYGVRVASRMDRLAETYTLMFSSANKWEDREVKLEVPVTDYFHEDGYLAEKTFRRRVGKVLQQYEQVDVQSDISTPRPKALNPKKHE